MQREKGNSQSERDFKALLSRLRNGQLSDAHYNLLSTRFTSKLSMEEQNAFRNSIQLYTTNFDTNSYNLMRLKQLDNPRAKINADHSCSKAKNATVEDAMGLEP